MFPAFIPIAILCSPWLLCPVLLPIAIESIPCVLLPAEYPIATVYWPLFERPAEFPILIACLLDAAFDEYPPACEPIATL